MRKNGINVPPPGRRLVNGLLSSLTFVGIGTTLLLLKAPPPLYQLFFIAALAWNLWVVIRYFGERDQPEDFVPWYYSRPKVCMALAGLNVLLGGFKFLHHESGYGYFHFCLTGILLIMAAIIQRKEGDGDAPSKKDEGN